ncbi:hypothetical protein Dda_3101 [Drechslerella dactyloides]|uniref:DNA/RNA-binding domain-containing protein n=1 Tax=Drechslerella dactyloides TaxID=74499 RepID=A0AAD6J298_DREDA|nr:hypothetical protein Dda_3101 [Drechslerella dactyloides]
MDASSDIAARFRASMSKSTAPFAAHRPEQAKEEPCGSQQKPIDDTAPTPSSPPRSIRRRIGDNPSQRLYDPRLYDPYADDFKRRPKPPRPITRPGPSDGDHPCGCPGCARGTPQNCQRPRPRREGPPPQRPTPVLLRRYAPAPPRAPAPPDEDPEQQPELILQPETRPISQEQLVAEVKGIYAGLVMVEAKCIEVDSKQAAAATAGRDSKEIPRLNNEQWQALIALHRTLLHEHHDFFLASQHPSASPSLQKLVTKYAMPARMWRHGIHSFLELLRNRLPASLEHMLAFIYLAYSMMALLYETVPAFADTWVECLGDLGRYRMAIEEGDVRDREIWMNVSRVWYSKENNRQDCTGLYRNTNRLYHHLAILARPNILQQLFFYHKALAVTQPFDVSRESILGLFDGSIGVARPKFKTPGVHIALCGLSPQPFDIARQSILGLFDGTMGSKVKDPDRLDPACVSAYAREAAFGPPVHISTSGLVWQANPTQLHSSRGNGLSSISTPAHAFYAVFSRLKECIRLPAKLFLLLAREIIFLVAGSGTGLSCHMEDECIITGTNRSGIKHEPVGQLAERRNIPSSSNHIYAGTETRSADTATADETFQLLADICFSFVREEDEDRIGPQHQPSHNALPMQKMELNNPLPSEPVTRSYSGSVLSIGCPRSTRTRSSHEPDKCNMDKRIEPFNFAVQNPRVTDSTGSEENAELKENPELKEISELEGDARLEELLRQRKTILEQLQQRSLPSPQFKTSPYVTLVPESSHVTHFNAITPLLISNLRITLHAGSLYFPAGFQHVVAILDNTASRHLKLVPPPLRASDLRNHYGSTAMDIYPTQSF